MVQWILYVEGRKETSTHSPKESYRLHFRGLRLKAMGYRVRLVRKSRNQYIDCL